MIIKKARWKRQVYNKKRTPCWLCMVVLGESVVSARVKKYFFAQRTMTVIRDQPANTVVSPSSSAARGRRFARPGGPGEEFDVGFPQTLSVTIKPGTIHNNKVFRAASSCQIFSKNLLMEKIPVKLYVYDISRGFAKQLSPLLLGESFIRQ